MAYLVKWSPADNTYDCEVLKDEEEVCQFLADLIRGGVRLFDLEIQDHEGKKYEFFFGLKLFEIVPR